MLDDELGKDGWNEVEIGYSLYTEHQNFVQTRAKVLTVLF